MLVASGEKGFATAAAVAATEATMTSPVASTENGRRGNGCFREEDRIWEREMIFLNFVFLIKT